jgi:hypothetical protein
MILLLCHIVYLCAALCIFAALRNSRAICCCCGPYLPNQDTMPSIEGVSLTCIILQSWLGRQPVMS